MTGAVALIGPFDQPSLSLQLLRRVATAELRDRCPSARLRVIAPSAGAPGLDPVEVYAGALPAVEHIIVAGDPTITAGWVTGAHTVHTLSLDAVLLAPRTYTSDEIEQRRAFLIAMGWWPEQGAVTVVHGRAPAASDGNPVVIIEAEPGDERDGSPRISLRDGASVDDVVTALALAERVVTSSPIVRAIANAFRGSLPDAGVRAAAATFDDLAAALTGRAAERLVAPEVDALRRALDARGRRLSWERAAMADRAWAIERRLEGEIAARDARIAELEREVDALQNHTEVKARAAIARVARRWRTP
jgi:hypothetical protein